MESQLQHTHGRHYDDPDTLTAGHHTSHDHGYDEHHGEKKSVIKKVKEKAKKIKNTITKHGHGHGDHDHHHHDDEDEDDDDDDDETVEDPEVHGAPMYDSARVGEVGLNANLAQLGGNLERPSVLAEDRYPEPVASLGAAPHVSTGAYGTNLSEPSGVGHDRAYDQEKWRGKIGESIGMEEEPFAPKPTMMVPPIDVTGQTYGTRHVPDPNVNLGVGRDVNQGGLRGVIGKGVVPDPHAPKVRSSLGSDPSNYGTKVDNPTHTGGKEAELSQLQHSFDKMGIESEPKTFDPNHPENLPRETLTGNPSSHTSGYANKGSSSASAIADKAATAKDAIASKLGYSGPNPTTKSHESVNNPVSATDYAHKITDKVTGTLAPVYEKVMDAGSSVISKVQGSVSGTGQQQVHGGSETSSPNVTDKGVSVKEHLVETLRPGDEDKALSEVITHALHRGQHEESEKKSRDDRDRPMGIVTESEEVRRRLGTDRQFEHHSGSVIADKSVADRLMNAMGSWFGGKGDAPQGTLGTSYVTDEGLSSDPTGYQNRGSGRERDWRSE